MSDRIEAEARQQWAQKGALEQTTAVAIGGPPQLRRRERSYFLGQFPERVYKAASVRAFKQQKVAPAVLKALQDQNCDHLFLNATIVPLAGAVLEQAKRCNLPVTIVYAPDYRDKETALVITGQTGRGTGDIWLG
ncbi:MAG: DUF1694 domain-containing protein [Bacillota bacterium]|jgi:uncharacterized protein YueI